MTADPLAAPAASTTVRVGPRLVPVYGDWQIHTSGQPENLIPLTSVTEYAWGPWRIATGRNGSGDHLYLACATTGEVHGWRYDPAEHNTQADADAARLLAAAMLSGQGPRPPALETTLHDAHTGAPTGTIAVFTAADYDTQGPVMPAAVVWFTADTAAVSAADSVRTALEWWADDVTEAADQAEALGAGLEAPYGLVVAWQLRRQVHEAFAHYDLGRLGEAIRAAAGKRGDGVVIRAITGLSGTWYSKVRKGEEWPAWPYSHAPS